MARPELCQNFEEKNLQTWDGSIKKCIYQQTR